MSVHDLCFLFTLAFMMHTLSLRAAIALYLLVLMALLLCVGVRVLVGWQNNKNEVCLPANRSALKGASA